MGCGNFDLKVRVQIRTFYLHSRLDGFEVFGYVVGTLVSPHILDSLGPVGSYSCGAGTFALALTYLAFFVKEPVERKAVKSDEKGFIKNLILTAIKTPFVGMKSLFTKKRKTQLKLLVLLQLFMFTIYWMVIEVQMVRYLYMLLVFDNFGPTENAYFSVFTNMCTVFSLMVIMPILSSKLKLHDALILFIIVTSEAISSVAAPFAKELWQFWIISGIGSFGLCKYSVVRSLISNRSRSEYTPAILNVTIPKKIYTIFTCKKRLYLCVK